jgi:hypothetical protein
MEQVTIQDCGCIALPDSVAAALDLRKGMTLDVALSGTGDAILLTPHRETSKESGFTGSVPTSSCVILPPSR